MSECGRQEKSKGLPVYVRMCKPKGAGMQRRSEQGPGEQCPETLDPVGGARAGGGQRRTAVGRIAEEGKPQVRGVDADLVRPAGLQHELHDRGVRQAP
eukprot:CAMPEP_0177376368 /NCGR_PEP_ID=MMETSP0368-20130122/45198_1 /TAXON_ID=447022 ORGANISM="Scrippsiella hangoei-like, Strain SHHI-4" /NCGR_SAMPLE_ID=MMETSP0368 /ASSEMBLY_ACC=CAM_ASM_000363 /LENGTH=97 /DNA_ID=CAMNT_0018840115 /DNA_START=27 /DNA_END=320 /DNA_ORIENTATION=+